MSKATPADQPPLVVVGALHVDELVWPTASFVARASNPVRREWLIGGVGANVARAAARHGTRDVVMVAALGDDAEGGRLERSLVAEGIDVLAQIVPGRASGRYTVVHDERGELFVGLADTALAEVLDAATVRERLARRCDIGGLLLDANLDGACLGALVATGSELGQPVIALAVSPSKAQRLAPHLAAIDLLFCNRREAAALGRVDEGEPIERLGDALADAGCAQFVLSDGADAVLVHTPGGRTSVAVPHVAVVGSVNGAGDALAGATVARWLDSDDLVAAVREAGMPAAAAVVSAPSHQGNAS